jgi:hypothetical protein
VPTSGSAFSLPLPPPRGCATWWRYAMGEVSGDEDYAGKVVLEVGRCVQRCPPFIPAPR